jgi:hypothetical protein
MHASVLTGAVALEEFAVRIVAVEPMATSQPDIPNVAELCREERCIFVAL